ncbi:hypothetical protein P3T24_001927 [Paraburkholderia sp. GAS33]
MKICKRKRERHGFDSLKIGMTNNVDMLSAKNRIIAVGLYQISPAWDFGNFLCTQAGTPSSCLRRRSKDRCPPR